jgi:hypothetical protein
MIPVIASRRRLNVFDEMQRTVSNGAIQVLRNGRMDNPTRPILPHTHEYILDHIFGCIW